MESYNNAMRGSRVGNIEVHRYLYIIVLGYCDALMTTPLVQTFNGDFIKTKTILV